MGVLSSVQFGVHRSAVWVERSLEDERVSHAEANILAYLARNPSATINDVHHHFGHRRSTLTNLVDRLESRGLVRRIQTDKSRRLVGLELTEEGRDVAIEIAELSDWLEERIRASVTNADMEGFQRVMKALEENTR